MGELYLKPRWNCWINTYWFLASALQLLTFPFLFDNSHLCVTLQDIGDMRLCSPFNHASLILIHIHQVVVRPPALRHPSQLIC